MAPESLHLAPDLITPTRIVTFALPKSKGFLQSLTNSTHLEAPQDAKIESTRTIESSPESPQGGYSSNLDRNPDGSSSPTTTPESCGSSTPSPPPPPQEAKPQSLDVIRIEAAREAVGLFRSWAREDIIGELNEALAVKDASGMEAELLQKMSWVKECLRGRYQIWIQCSEACTMEAVLRSTRGNKDLELKSLCGYPGCGRTWGDGEIRVSFEPPGWTVTEKIRDSGKNKKKKVNFELDGALDEGEEDDSTIIEEDGKNLNDTGDGSKEIRRLPDYHNLLTSSRYIRLHGRGEFFCLHCFEKLLAPPSAPAAPGKKRKREENKQYLRPSPLCRIYGSVFPETRISADGRFQLDEDSEDLVERWKDALFDKGLKKIRDRFGGLLGKAEEDQEEVDDREVGDGRGLAELLRKKKKEVGGTIKRRK